MAAENDTDLRLAREQIDRLDVGIVCLRWVSEPEHFEVTFANRAYLAGLPERERERVLGAPLAESLPAGTIEEVEAHLHRARRRGASVCTAMPVTFAGGGTRWYRWTAVTDPTDADRLTAIVVDVTAAHELAEARRGLLMRELAASDRARRELGAALHDTVVQSLTELSLRIGVGTDREALGRLVDRTLGQCREVMGRLQPPSAAAGASVAVEQLIDEWQQAGLVDVTVEGPPLPSLGRKRDTLLYLVERELLANAMEHAPGSSVRLRHVVGDDALVVEIADDGPGMTFEERARAQARGHVGLALVEERVRDLGGALTIDSAPGAGTRVVVTLPP
jgi:signal transduction histidine kinase